MDTSPIKLKKIRLLISLFMATLLSFLLMVRPNAIGLAIESEPPPIHLSVSSQTTMLVSPERFPLIATQVQTETSTAGEAGEDGAAEGLAPPQSDLNASGIVLNEVALIDTLVSWFAWLWLCFGVCALASLFIIFPFLQMRGAQLRRQQADVEVVDEMY